MEKERHGFVTFWLWLMIIGDSIMAIAGFANNSFLAAQYNYNRALLVIWSLQNIGFCIAAILILNWINGFWLILCVSILTPFINPGVNLFILIIGTALGCLLQFGILHLKKNGVSTWDYITNKAKQKINIKKCRQCNTIYSGYTGSFCQNCGSRLYEDEEENTTTKSYKKFIDSEEKSEQLKNVASALTGPKFPMDQSLADENSWKCPNCNNMNPNNLYKCSHCKYSIV